jgi:hypothetical protein
MPEAFDVRSDAFFELIPESATIERIAGGFAFTKAPCGMGMSSSSVIFGTTASFAGGNCARARR